MTTTRNPGTSRRAPDPRSHPSQKPEHHGAQAAVGTAVVGVKRIFAAETGNFFLLLGTTLFLVIFGLVMVLSSSSVESHIASDDFFASFSRQGLYALIGIPIMLVASRMSIAFWKRWAWPAVGLGLALQLLVFTPLGFGYGGNRNWIKIGESFTAQPSEMLKLALIVWVAYILTSKAGLLHDWRHVLIPIAPVAGIGIGLVLLGNDLGTAIIMLAIVLGALFFAGVKLRFLLTPVAVVALLGVIIAFASSSRSDRINAWLDGCSSERDYLTLCWQQTHGTWALASGGIFGVGLGNSKAKWSWLPEADNDYIFAIIGEELGLIGAVVVLLLFIVLAFGFIRIIRSNPDPFARVVTAGVGIWIVAQALVNIAVVLGVLPVLGVPLPLISAGGSALIATLLGIGVVLSFARERPDAPFVAPSRRKEAKSGGSSARDSGARDSKAPGTRARSTARAAQAPATQAAPVALTPAERSRLAASQRKRPTA
jgi:cell division protein FtsW